MLQDASDFEDILPQHTTDVSDCGKPGTRPQACIFCKRKVWKRSSISPGPPPRAGGASLAAHRTSSLGSLGQAAAPATASQGTAQRRGSANMFYF